MCEVSVVTHYIVSNLLVHLVEFCPQDQASVAFHEGSPKDTVDVIQVRSIHPFWVAIQEALAIAKLIVVSRSSCRWRPAH